MNTGALTIPLSLDLRSSAASGLANAPTCRYWPDAGAEAFFFASAAARDNGGGVLLRRWRPLLDGTGRGRDHRGAILRDFRFVEHQWRRTALGGPPLLRVDAFDLDPRGTGFGVTELLRGRVGQVDDPVRIERPAVVDPQDHAACCCPGWSPGRNSAVAMSCARHSCRTGHTLRRWRCSDRGIRCRTRTPYPTARRSWIPATGSKSCPARVYGLALYGPVCRVGVASGMRDTSTSHHGAPSLWARLMSSPGVARTAVVDVLAPARGWSNNWRPALPTRRMPSASGVY